MTHAMNIFRSPMLVHFPLTTRHLAWVVCCFALAFWHHPTAADWPQFRGPNSSGIAQGPAGPINFGPGQNEVWHVPLGPGHSSPCIVGDVIYVTTFAADRQQFGIVCLNRADGTIRWQRELQVERVERGHPSFNPASSSPAADQERVVAYFGSYGLICFDKSGKKQWERRMPLTKSYAGNATSPAILGDQVILYRGNYVDHFLLSLDKRTGEELWRVDQTETFTGEMACTACPIVAGDQLIVHTARALQAFDLASGKRRWVVKCATTATSTPILAGQEVIVAACNKLGEPALRPAFPSFEELLDKHDRDKDQQISRDEFPKLWIFHRPEGIEAPQNGATVRFERADRNRDREIDAQEWRDQLAGIEKFRSQYNTHGILAVPLNSQGVLDEDDIRVLETQGIPEVPSPLCDGQYVYLVKNGGVLTCLDLKSGKRLHRVRTRGRGTHYASPLIAGKHLYTVAGDGRISVLTLGPKPKLLATNDMQENVYASPAMVDGTLYVRTHSALYAFRAATTD